jgi:hypothetical protein
MVAEILRHTPAWVFALFALLVWLGLAAAECALFFARALRILRAARA